MTDAVAFNDRRSLGRHSFAGLFAIFGLFGGLVFWASTIDIAGAVMASGSIVVQSYPKRVQHLDGGTVSALLVGNEDKVEAGQTLLTIDSTEIKASLSVVQGQWREALVLEARLMAEIEGLPTFDLPEELADLDTDTDIASLMSVENQVAAARQTAQMGRASQLREQIEQLENQILGMGVQQKALDDELTILGKEISNLEALQAIGLVESTRVTALSKQRVQLQGQSGQMISTIAGARAAISERELQIAQLEDDFLTTALEQLQVARRTVADTGEQMRALQERLRRTEIRAPQAGIVHELLVHTVGGVIAPGETLMYIVPQDDDLSVTVRLSPMDVDRVVPGQKARLRLSGLDQRETPELDASIGTIAPDVTQDQGTGLVFYTARVLLEKEEMARLPNPDVLVPGMPVEVFITTSERSVLSYLIQPFVDQLNKAMRE